MGKKKVTFEIEEEVLTSLQSRFPEAADQGALLKALSRLALIEWERWLSAGFRPRTVSALTQERVAMIFDDPDIYLGQRVTRGLLFNQFSLPYGEASYIERVFAERDQPKQCRSALSSAIDVLEGQLNEYDDDDQADPGQSFSVDVDTIGHRLLQGALQKAKDNDAGVSANVQAQHIHGYFTYTFDLYTAKTILESIKDLLGRFEV